MKVGTNTDGGNSYTGTNEHWPFTITGRADGESPAPAPVTGQTLLDNDKVTVILLDKTEGSNFVGYNLYIENKTDKYVMVNVDNASVDGFMTYINLQGSTLAPGKKSYAVMRVSTKNTDIKSMDDLKNVEGSFTISTNTDGGHSYTGTNDHYPFKID